MKTKILTVVISGDFKSFLHSSLHIHILILDFLYITYRTEKQFFSLFEK